MFLCPQLVHIYVLDYLRLENGMHYAIPPLERMIKLTEYRFVEESVLAPKVGHVVLQRSPGQDHFVFCLIPEPVRSFGLLRFIPFYPLALIADYKVGIVVLYLFDYSLPPG